MNVILPLTDTQASLKSAWVAQSRNFAAFWRTELTLDARVVFLRNVMPLLPETPEDEFVEGVFSKAIFAALFFNGILG